MQLLTELSICTFEFFLLSFPAYLNCFLNLNQTRLNPNHHFNHTNTLLNLTQSHNP